jgi:leucyl aminopeptidase
MLSCLQTASTHAIPLNVLRARDFDAFRQTCSAAAQRWMQVMQFAAKPNTYVAIPQDDGAIQRVVVGVDDAPNPWALGDMALRLPPHDYYLDALPADLNPEMLALGWVLGAYKFTRYKEFSGSRATLCLADDNIRVRVLAQAEAIYLARDLINTPAEDLGPAELAEAASLLAERYNASFSQLVGEELLHHTYPMIHAVGRASHRAPRLIEFYWGDSAAPKVTLVGKGVCFDSGGLDLKPSSAMRLMKKDMGGAAHALALAAMIMARPLPVYLHVVIPAVDNAVAGNAFRPGDVIRTRAGKTVEIDNTDAEGRLILCDALALVAEQNPELVLDFSTLTGAARTALGTDIPALFTNRDELAQQLLAHSQQQQDPLWPMPLHKPYRDMLNSNVADIANGSASPYAGAITAALFLQEFVPDDVPWLHFDLMAWNTGNKPGRPEGGEAMGIRAVFAYLCQRYGG